MPLHKGKEVFKPKHSKVVQIPLRLREEARPEAKKPPNPLGRPSGKTCKEGHDDWKILPGGQRYCRICHSARHKDYAAKHKVEIAAHNKEWRDKNKVYIQQASRDWRERSAEERKLKRHLDWKQNKERLSVKRLCRRYGMTSQQYEEMVRTQGGLCAICGRPESRTWQGKLRTLSLDHDHETGKARALLCADCNAAIGLFQEDPERMKSAIEYVERFCGMATNEKLG